MMEIEKTILKGAISEEDFTREVIPYIKDEYFSTREGKQIYSLFYEYFNKYNCCPDKDMFLIDLEARSGFSEEQYKDVRETVEEIFEHDVSKYNKTWYVQETEKWCKERAMFNAVLEAVGIIDGSNTKDSPHAIPDMMRDALGVSFDSSIGHSYLEGADERIKFYKDVTQKFAFDLSFLNMITKGGVPRKTLNCCMASTGGGKSQFLCHLAAGYIRSGLNVVYVSLEMEEKRIAERIDANILDMKVDDLSKIDEKKYLKRTENAFKKIQGKLIIKEYPATTMNTNHLMALLEELKTKKGFVPDIVIIDYLNLMSSTRYKSGKENSYTIVKAVAEEVRSIAQELDIAIWTATQTNRDGIDSSDLGMKNIADSIGLAYTLDFLVALVPDDDLEAKKQIRMIQLKNRYSEKAGQFTNFILGLDRSKMKFYDVNVSASTGLMGNTPQTEPAKQPNFHGGGSGYGSELQKTEDKFKNFDFNT